MKTRQFFTIIFMALLSTTTFAQSTWQADKAHSQVSFGITHMRIAEVEGLFKEFDATIVAANEDFSDAQYTVEIMVPSIDTGVEMRDNHLRNADFFNVDKYPKMTFKSTSSEKVGDGKYSVKGDLTFHGVTKPVTLEVWHRGTVQDQKGNSVSGFAISGTVSRSDFNLGPDFPEAMLSDKVVIDVDAEFKKS